MRIGDKDILIPTMMTGNYPKPRWYNGASYANVPVGSYMPDSISFEAFEDTLATIVRDQDAAGLDVISDGRVLGGDSPFANIIYYFTERIHGYKPYGPPLSLPLYSTLYSPTVDEAVSRKVPMLLQQLQVLKRHTDKPIKLQYPGLAALTMGSHNTHYADVKDLSFALAKVYNEEFKQVVEAGASVIQMDEFAWHYGLSLGQWEIDVFNTAVAGVEAYVMPHVCWGSYMGTKGYLPSGPMHGESEEKEGTTYVLSKRDPEGGTPRAKALFPRVNQLNLHALNFEIGNTGLNDLKPLKKNGWDKDFVPGVIDVRKVEIETADEVADRLRACLEIIPPERLGASTDCGLINLPRIVAQAKLRALVDGVQIIRDEVTAAAAAGSQSSVPEPVGATG